MAEEVRTFVWDPTTSTWVAATKVSGSSSVAVNNFPATQPVSGTVAVSNLPATQPVSAASALPVAVNNFPATQPVSGTVAVNNFPATQPVSGTVAVSTVAGNVTVVGGATLAVSQAAPAAPVASVANALSAFRVVATATTNVNLVKATAARVYTAHFTNVAASARYIKLFNKATAPVTGTDTPILTLLVPANSNERLNFGVYGKSFSNGLGIAITAGPTDLDNTAVAANDVYAHLDYL